MIEARAAQTGLVYKVTGGSAFYMLAPRGTAKALVKRLEAKGRAVRCDEQMELTAAREALRGTAILFVRYMRGRDPFTGAKFELRTYRGLRPDQPLRLLKRKPGYGGRREGTAA